MSENLPRQRVGAYGICVTDGRILLSKYAVGHRRWSLPGGGVDHGEHPSDAVVREVEEETGYLVRPDDLLGVESAIWDVPEGRIHALHLIYLVTITGGELRHEVDGSSDQAGWWPLAALPDLDHTQITDAGIALLKAHTPDIR